MNGPAGETTFLPERSEKHAVGLQGDQLLDIVGRDHAGGWQADEFTRVLADLLRIGDEHTDQFNCRVLNEVLEGYFADRAGGPLNDAIFLLRHGMRCLKFS